ncbi:MAG: alpha/beta hydrolase [Candidatus Paceibacterota bacterium]
MKNAIILHGTKDKNTDFWFPYLKEKLEERGFEVWLPELPNSEIPNLRDNMTFVLKNGKFTNDTVLIGHSSGAQLILSILENIESPIKQAILVSGYAKALRATPEDEKNVKDFNWEKIKGKADKLVFINSDNDPWTCDDKQGRIMLDNLGGVQIILHGEGHMGSTMFKQPYKEFPLLVKLIEE